MFQRPSKKSFLISLISTLRSKTDANYFRDLDTLRERSLSKSVSDCVKIHASSSDVP